MKTYPYIGQCYSAMILFYAEDEGLVLDDALGLDDNTKVGDKVTLHGGTDITHEYLQNTYGEVVSPEHAEFIIELAKSEGFEFTTGTNKDYPCWFTFDDELYFFKSKVYASDSGRKQITIPLPPKFNKTSEILNPDNVKVELSKPEPLKNAGDNLILGCEQDFKKARVVASDLRKDMVFSDKLLAKGYEWEVTEEDVKELDFISRAWTPIESKGNEWPQVGDEVALRYKFDSKQVMHTGKLLYLSDNHIIIATDKNGDYHCHRCDWSIEKPKTPEEELRDDIVKLIDDADGLSSHVLALALMDKFNIKPQ